MSLFVASVAVVLIVSAICSLTEASLYAVRRPYARQLSESGSSSGRLLLKFKDNMEQPITAILILNTVANTAGAAIAGAQARLLFGESALIWFSVAFTLAVLMFAEIFPKVAGVAYSRPVARFVAAPLNAVILALYPFVWLIRRMTGVLQRSEAEPEAPEDEVRQLAALSAEEGSILPIEAELVKNVLRLNEVKASEIMTPRTVVLTLTAELSVKQAAETVMDLPHARIPVHPADDPENWTGLVLKNDILTRMSRDQFEVTIGELCKPLGFVPETMPGHRLLNEFLTRHTHLLGVVGEYGELVGIVTLEDVMESLIGKEIIDETDQVVDLQEAARRGMRRPHSKQKNGDDA